MVISDCPGGQLLTLPAAVLLLSRQRRQRHFGGSILPATLCLRLLTDALGINMLLSPTCFRAEKLATLARGRSESPTRSEAEVLIDSLGPGPALIDIEVSPIPMPIRKGLTEARLAPPAKAETPLVGNDLKAGEASVPDDEGEPDSNFRSYGAGAILRRMILREDCGPIPDSRRESLAVSVIEMTEVSPMLAVRAEDDAVGLSRRERDEVDAEGKMGLCRDSARGESLGCEVGNPVPPRRDTLPDAGDSMELPSSETVFRPLVKAVRCRNAFQSFR